MSHGHTCPIGCHGPVCMILKFWDGGLINEGYQVVSLPNNELEYNVSSEPLL